MHSLRYRVAGGPTAGSPRFPAMLVVVLLVMISLPGEVRAQGFLEQFSYDDLGFSAVGAEAGIVWSDQLTTEWSGGIRLDYGMIAPQIRVLFGGSYFKGLINEDEILQFEQSILRVVDDPTGDATIDIGEITWADLQLNADLQYLVPAGARYFFYFGLGMAAHVRRGAGGAIEGTFVEDALNTIAAAAVGSVGVEIAAAEQLHLVLDTRGSLSSELRTLSVRLGAMYRIRPLLPR